MFGCRDDEGDDDDAGCLVVVDIDPKRTFSRLFAVNVSALVPEGDFEEKAVGEASAIVTGSQIARNIENKIDLMTEGEKDKLLGGALGGPLGGASAARGAYPAEGLIGCEVSRD